jgi:hypothetical protein
MSPAVSPRLSVLMLVHESSRQAENSLSSVLAPYQEETDGGVELVVVETASRDVLGETRARAHGDGIRYFGMDVGSTRIDAMTVGLGECRGELVGLFMDGAHILSPRAIDTATRAANLCERPLIVIPEYRFDEASVPGSHRSDDELAWLERVNWKKDSHQLFDAARLGPANPTGFLGPLLGAAGLFAKREQFATLSTPSPLLDVPGGYALRLSIYTQLARVPGTRLIVLAGEGAFRQHHAELDAAGCRHAEESPQNLLVSAVLPIQNYSPVFREPLIFGAVASPAQRFLVHSAEAAAYHSEASTARGENPWFEDD